MYVTPRHFTEHLEVIRKYGQPTHLADLTEALSGGKRPHRMVVVTFDDGYADNLLVAKPLLERYDIPATFFVISGGANQKREFWWDELDRLLLEPGMLPGTLDLSINGSRYRWELNGATYYGDDERQRNRHWKMSDPEADDPGPRQRLFRALYKLLLPLSEEERWKVLDELSAWADAEPVIRPTHRALSANEVIDVARGGLIEVGAHTVTHPMLADHSAAVQHREIRQSKNDLEDILGQPVSSFAYPHGSHTTETAALVREIGFTSACSTRVGVVWRGADRFSLPRIW
ncbi:MAG: polysaccharide deacetylase family protein, partial [Pyrinomonadaceae bacterium]|nr:polysaccharide deacetylase family protein [Pyrinomonadaceae bacterium]